MNETWEAMKALGQHVQDVESRGGQPTDADVARRNHLLGQLDKFHRAAQALEARMEQQPTEPVGLAAEPGGPAARPVGSLVRSVPQLNLSGVGRPDPQVVPLDQAARRDADLGQQAKQMTRRAKMARPPVRPFNQWDDL